MGGMAYMNEGSATQHVIRTVRLDDVGVGKILDTLDEADVTNGSDASVVRYRYRLKALVLHIQQLGASETFHYLVPTRKLSHVDLCFLFGGFIHPGTRCMAQLITPHGTWNNAAGEVVSCRYVSNNIHDVMMCFDQHVDPSVYCAEAVDSRVLVVEDDPSEAKLLAFHLQKLNAKVEIVGDGQQALEMVQSHTFDLILMDILLPNLDGIEAVKELRKRGYSGTVVAATSLTAPEDRDRCLAAGFDRYLAKPVSRTELATVMASLREEPLFSSLMDSPGMEPLIDEFVQGLPGRIRVLEEARMHGDLEGVKQVARMLKAQGSGFGFDPITDAAGKIEKAVLAGSALQTLGDDITQLIRLCMQARSSTRAE
ncbi:MAG: response regulator [Phycisphaerae bacterium]|nr:response regulator [Phycisphaerae bacterium]